MRTEKEIKDRTKNLEKKIRNNANFYNYNELPHLYGKLVALKWVLNKPKVKQ